jgi:hypothetical protein
MYKLNEPNNQIWESFKQKTSLDHSKKALISDGPTAVFEHLCRGFEEIGFIKYSIVKSGLSGNLTILFCALCGQFAG